MVDHQTNNKEKQLTDKVTNNNALAYSLLLFVIGSLLIPLSVSLLLPALMFNGLLTSIR